MENLIKKIAGKQFLKIGRLEDWKIGNDGIPHQVRDDRINDRIATLCSVEQFKSLMYFLIRKKSNNLLKIALQFLQQTYQPLNH